ncbi:hypothetical protein [Rhodoblastus sp.]|uniref:hypothetical protein n=1 Tax=Rhodoblastus sp. TaxID=1962975 RepID=UPI0035AE3FC9
MIRTSLAAILALGLVCASAEAFADERPLDGLLGAGAGALVFGPVGLVAGGVIGYAAGPGIGCGLRGGCGRRRHAGHYRHQASASTTTPRN